MSELWKLFQLTHLRCILIPVVICVGLAHTHSGTAQDLRAPSQDETSSSKNKTPQLTVVVVTNGEIFQGPVEEESLGYMVNVWNGRVFVPFRQVRAVGTSLSDAYTRMAGGLINPTANDHINLATWCLKHRLVTEAKTELTAALELEPTRTEARELLGRLESMMAAENSQPNRGDTTATSFAGNESLRDLVSRESTATFIRTIQPLMTNRCGNAACHGSGEKSSFHFRPARSGLRLAKSISMDNLDAVLQVIDLNDPQASSLFTIQTQQTPPHDRVFVGRHAGLQQKVLQRWVEQVATEISDRRSSQPSNTAGSSSTPTPRMLPAQTNEASLLTKPIPLPGALPHSGEFQSEHERHRVDAGFLRSLAQQQQPDPFDPEEFNRKVHGSRTTNPVANE